MPKKKTSKKEDTLEDLLEFSRPRKLLFEWLSVAILFSLLGNIIVVLAHALAEREERWWCGQATTVRRSYRMK